MWIDWDPRDRYASSLKYALAAESLTPGGAQTRSRRQAAFVKGAFPAALVCGNGGRTTCVDGHEYVDLLMGLASVGIGHGYQPVADVASSYALSGGSLSLACSIEAEYAAELLDALHWPEQVRFIKTGSEATEAAVRIARRATGRDTVLTVGSGYHSWHAWFQAISPEHPGVPRQYEELIRSFEYNDLVHCETLCALIQARSLGHTGQGLAAIILEPTLLTEPKPGFLAGVKAIAKRYGAVLIFDEMVCGFRWNLGGGGAYYGVEPDLACFGKAMANGFPLACVVGKRDLMQYADVISGTFGGEAVGLAAGLATLRAYLRDDVIGRQWAVGDAMLNVIRTGLAEAGLPFRIIGSAVHPKVQFDFDTDDMNRYASGIWVQELARFGVLMHPAGWNVCAMHTDEDLHVVRLASLQAAESLQYAVEQEAWTSVLKGVLPEAPVRKPPSEKA